MSADLDEQNDRAGAQQSRGGRQSGSGLTHRLNRAGPFVVACGSNFSRLFTDLAMKILIVGGGIAGLSLARALELRGLQADLIEHHADEPATGTGLYLPGNATRALEQLGLDR